MNGSKVKIRAQSAKSSVTLRAILEELRMLRNEMQLLLPQENLTDYAHLERIKRSYLRAVKHYPPAFL